MVERKYAPDREHASAAVTISRERSKRSPTRPSGPQPATCGSGRGAPRRQVAAATSPHAPAAGRSAWSPLDEELRLYPSPGAGSRTGRPARHAKRPRSVRSEEYCAGRLRVEEIQACSRAAVSRPLFDVQKNEREVGQEVRGRSPGGEESAPGGVWRTTTLEERVWRGALGAQLSTASRGGGHGGRTSPGHAECGRGAGEGGSPEGPAGRQDVKKKPISIRSRSVRWASVPPRGLLAREARRGRKAERSNMERLARMRARASSSGSARLTRKRATTPRSLARPGADGPWQVQLRRG